MNRTAVVLMVRDLSSVFAVFQSDIHSWLHETRRHLKTGFGPLFRRCHTVHFSHTRQSSGKAPTGSQLAAMRAYFDLCLIFLLLRFSLFKRNKQQISGRCTEVSCSMSLNSANIWTEPHRSSILLKDF